jgi:hypothetical protein
LKDLKEILAAEYGIACRGEGSYPSVPMDSVV